MSISFDTIKQSDIYRFLIFHHKLSTALLCSPLTYDFAFSIKVPTNKDKMAPKYGWIDLTNVYAY